MLKYVESAITFTEFPDEITLGINLSLCPNRCPGCSESYLANDIGEILDESEIDRLIKKHPGITLVGFMGGDNDHEMVNKLADYIHKTYNLKVGIYSGRDFIDLETARHVDYYKVGHWIMPQGEQSEWHKTMCGPLSFPFTNQRMYKRDGNHLVDITHRFQELPVSNLKSKVIS